MRGDAGALEEVGSEWEHQEEADEHERAAEPRAALRDAGARTAAARQFY